MGDITPIYSYKETRINLESAIPGATVILRLPTHGTSSWSSRTAQKRPLPTDIPPTEDESAFKQRYLASASSIYHRQHHKSPRSFLWRILEDGKVLAIRAVDLSKQEKAPDAYLTLRLHLPSPIRPYCISFSDSKDHDVLNVFLLTESNHLYSLTLRPEFFVKRSSTEDNASDWCKTYLPTAFSHKFPHRLVALGSSELIATLHDGGFLRLTKRPGDHGAGWEESHYNEGGWGLRSLIPFQGGNTIQHGKVNMELSAITSIAAGATVIGDEPYVFSVSLDHRLRIWNLESRKVAYNGDLLNEERLPNELGKYIIQPTHANLVKVLQDVDGKPIVVTFSPSGAGQFKIWHVRQQIEGSLELEDVFDAELEPPTPTSDVWTLADFSVALDKNEAGKLALWILWKNNLTYRVQKLEFCLNSPEDIRAVWRNDWVSVANEVLSDIPLPMASSYDAEDSTQKWLDHILYPARFTSATIETALSLYEKGIGATKTTISRGSKNLAERLCAVIASSTTLNQGPNDSMDYNSFRSATDAQWRRFFRLVAELDKQRGEALSLSYDSENELASIATADGVALIRDCSSIERIWLNADHLQSDNDESVTRLVTSAAAFSDSFSDNLLHTCKVMLKAELAQDSSSADVSRLRAFYGNCNFAGQISDEDYAQLIQNLGGNFKGVTQEAYMALFGDLTAADESDDRLEQLPLAEFGMKATVKGVQETIEMHKTICFDQLALLAFIEGEIDQEEEGMYLDTGLIYSRLLAVLRRLELLSWLCKTQISLLLPKSSRTVLSSEKTPAKKPSETKTVTVLSASLAHLLGLITHSGSPSSSLFTDLVIRICHPDSEYVLQPALIQCFLLKIGRPDLAEECTLFCDQDPFSVYVQGRVFLATKDLYAAAMCFKKAAFGLAHADPKLKDDRNSASLLDDTEWNLLYSGLPKYYSHIVSLYEKEKCYSMVIDFSRLGLQFCRPKLDDAAISDIRSDLLGRLFNSALQTAQFESAYSALLLYSDLSLQHSSLRRLVEHICTAASTSQLFEMPFLGLQDAVDEILAQKCHSVVDTNAGVPYHQILYTWRIRHSDFRGAAAVSLDRLQKIQAFGFKEKLPTAQATQDGFDTPVTRQYLALINALSCVDPKQAWILSEVVPTKTSKSNGGNGATNLKRKVITLEDVRRDYQKELDRIAAIENNQFAFAGGDEMDIL